MNATEHSVVDLILSGEQKRSANARKKIIVKQLVDCLFALIVLISITVFCEIFQNCCSDINLQYTAAGSVNSALFFEFDSSKKFMQRSCGSHSKGGETLTGMAHMVRIAEKNVQVVEQEIGIDQM